MKEASVQLLDEPMTGVDRVTEEPIVALFGELRGAGATILYVTHGLEGAADDCDLLASSTRLIDAGPPAETFTPVACMKPSAGSS